jgi:carbonic anhydrase
MRKRSLIISGLLAAAAMGSEHGGAPAASLDEVVARGAKGKPPVAAAAHAPADQAASPHQAAHGPAPIEALLRLSAGNARFVAGKRTRSSDPGDDAAERRATAKGQHPFAAILTCADSRLSPELIFDQSLGDVFVVRNAGNVAEPIGEGSLEYAVEHLGVRLVVVLGHASCGAVKAVSGSEGPLPGHLADIQRAMPGLRDFAVERAKAGSSPENVISEAVQRNAAAQAAALLAGSPVLRAAAAAETISVLSAVYDLDSGAVGFQPAAPVAPSASETPAAPPAGH